MQMDIVFVILHYLADKDTKECIESIISNIDTESYKIIVVDNGSNNGSYERLAKEFKDRDNVVLIHNDENLGFAKGNNVGIRYATQKFNPRFVAVINNDIILSERNFFKKLSDIYSETEFDVYGPQIVTKDGRKDSNPVSLKETSIKKCQYKRILFVLKLIFSYLALDELIFGRLLGKTLNSLNSGNKDHEKWNESEHTNAKLHGAFWVFSEKYFNVFDGLDPSTFLYSEEEILLTHILNNHMKTFYSPKVTVFHKEDVSTEAAMGKSLKKRRFVYKCSLKSLKECIRVKEHYREQAGLFSEQGL